MRLKFPNGFEAEYENHVGAGFIALGATEVLPKPAATSTPAGTDRITFFIGYNERGIVSLMAKKASGEHTYFQAPVFTRPTWFGKQCPLSVWEEWQLVRPLTRDESTLARDKYENEKFARQKATEKQASANEVAIAVAITPQDLDANGYQRPNRFVEV